MNFFQKISVVWQKVNLVQRAVLFAIVMACVISGALLTSWATRPDMRLLFGGLSLEETSRIADKISEKSMPYELRAGGTSIYVPADMVLTLRAEMAREGLPQSSEPGYKVFDDEKIGVSPLVQKMNYNRALQGELAKTIQMYDGIATARVHIVRPEQALFSGESKGATASVMIQLRPGWNLSSGTIAAITNLVAGATEGLKAENVTVTDNNGNLLSGNTADNGIVTSANTYMDYKQHVEKNIANSIERMLEGPLGPDRCRVKVTAVIDMTSVQTKTVTYEKGQPVEETINSTSTIKEGATDGEGQSKTPGSTDKQETIENKYMVPETVITKLDVPGKITSLSVSAFVDLSVPKPADNEEGTAEQAAGGTETATIMQIADVEEIIRNAVGTELLKDTGALTVKDVSFFRPAVTDLNESSSYEKMDFYLQVARHSSLGLMALCALIVMKMFSGAKKKADKENPQAQGFSLDAMSIGMLPAASPANEPGLMMKRQIAGYLRENPEQVRELITNWLSEES